MTCRDVSWHATLMMMKWVLWHAWRDVAVMWCRIRSSGTRDVELCSICIGFISLIPTKVMVMQSKSTTKKEFWFILFCVRTLCFSLILYISTMSKWLRWAGWTCCIPNIRSAHTRMRCQQHAFPLLFLSSSSFSFLSSLCPLPTSSHPFSTFLPKTSHLPRNAHSPIGSSILAIESQITFYQSRPYSLSQCCSLPHSLTHSFTILPFFL